MLFVPALADFKWWASNALTTRPAAAMGTSFTPGTAPTKGSWTQILTALANDAYGILICINSGSTSATTRNVHVDIGVDNAGGTSYVVKIPDLLGGHAAPYNVGSGGIWYYFPLYIPAGSTVAVRGAGNVTTALYCLAYVFGQPRRPDAVRCGSKVVALGATAASATGTSITLGTTSEGSWTQVGSALSDPLWWWQVGYTCVDTTMTLNSVHLDVAKGNASNKHILLENGLVVVTAAEQISNNIPVAGCIGNAAAGDLIYVRGQVGPSAADTSTSVMVWGLGG